MVVKLLLVGAMFAAQQPLPPENGFGGPSDDRPPPVLLDGRRSVTVRDANGGLQRLTTIPFDSAFARHGGGASATCSITADRDGFELSDRTTVPRGTRITSDYLFVEGLAVPFELPPRELPAEVTGVPTLGPISTGLRTFTVFCDGPYYEANRVTVIQVPVDDPIFQIDVGRDRLRNLLQLQRPVVFENPIVDTYGGLVTRYPTWLAIEPDAWRTQRSNAIVHRGATMLLVAQPRELDFVVDFRPDPDRPSTPFRGVVGCVPGEAATTGDGAFPAFPLLPDQTEPGVNGSCTWTPPGPGDVTITARITYTVTFWVNGFTAPDEDYVWTSAPTTYDTGELIAVNTRP